MRKTQNFAAYIFFSFHNFFFIIYVKSLNSIVVLELLRQIGVGLSIGDVNVLVGKLWMHVMKLLMKASIMMMIKRVIRTS